MIEYSTEIVGQTFTSGDCNCQRRPPLHESYLQNFSEEEEPIYRVPITGNGSLHAQIWKNARQTHQKHSQIPKTHVNTKIEPLYAEPLRLRPHTTAAATGPPT